MLIPTESDDYQSEISEPEDLDRYDSTFVVDDDEIVEESFADFNEESLLSDPSDLFENQTESEPESEPDIIYREKKLPHHPLVDFEADEDDDDELDDDRDILIEDDYDPSILDETHEVESDSEGPRREIRQPLNASDFVDEEASEHNDLAEMYDGIVGRQIISSDEEGDESRHRSIILDSDTEEDDPDENGLEDGETTQDISDADEGENDESCLETEIEESNDDTEILASSSTTSISPIKAPVIIRKRRRLLMLDTDSESSVKKIIRKKRRSEIELITIGSSFADGTSPLSTNSPLMTPSHSANAVKPVKPRSARKLILDSDDDDDKDNEENSSFQTNCPPIDLNDAFVCPNDSLSSPRVDKW